VNALINHLVQSTLFCGGVWLISLLLRRNSAAVRHTLWFIASLKFLVPFSALYFLGGALGFSLDGSIEPEAGLSLSPRSATPLAFSPLFLSLGMDANPAFPSSRVLIAMACLWALVAAWLAMRWLLAARAARLLLRAARPAPGVSPDVWVTDVPVEPSVARTMRPVVLLPAALPGLLAPGELAAVLAHEHEHIARRDNLKAQVHRLVETLFWFHPLVWWIGDKLLDERERACDEAVMANGHAPDAYAAGILAVCRHCAAAHTGEAVAALSGNLTQRIRQILVAPEPAALGAIKTFVLASLALAIVGTPVLAGAFDDTAHRRAVLVNNARTLTAARVDVKLAAGGGDDAARVAATGQQVTIKNSSLRELVALAYDVPLWRVQGGASWLDEPRYDIHALAAAPVSEPDDFDPAALRGVVAKLLATRFDLTIQVNQRCQDPCRRPPDTR
jgi:bla regulator protein blaR1